MTSKVTREASSFRDPNGHLFFKDGVLYRGVHSSYTADYELLESSGLLEALLDKKLLIPHEDVSDVMASEAGFSKVLKPEMIPFISYPYEWSFSQLKDAALLTLEVQSLALTKGMTLKDASAYNIQFHQGSPIFIDTLSFERYEEGLPWDGYKQFCQHFLAPLALMSHCDISLNKLMSSFIDGIPLDLASKLLPWKTKFSPHLGVHIHLHAKSQSKHAASSDGQKTSTLKRTQLDYLISGLTLGVNQLTWKGGGTEWADYYEETHNYSDEGMAHKYSLVKELIEEISPQTVWDLGANDGRFSRLAAEFGAFTLSLDGDPSCVEANYLQTRAQKTTNLVPLLQDLTNPSANIGWSNAERKSLVARGGADLVLSLGLIHHLVISNNTPFVMVAQFFVQICDALLIEFVPKEDSQVQLLLQSREDIFGTYEIESFRKEFAVYFEEQRSIKINSTQRTLFYLTKKTPNNA